MRLTFFVSGAKMKSISVDSLIRNPEIFVEELLAAEEPISIVRDGRVLAVFQPVDAHSEQPSHIEAEPPPEDGLKRRPPGSRSDSSCDWDTVD